MTSQSDVAIIGGGVIGLCTAFRLAYNSCISHSNSIYNNYKSPSLSHKSIIVIDQHNFQHSASSQATGILATQGARHYLSPLRRQIVESTQSYPELFSQLNQVLGTKQEEQVEYQPITHYYLYNLNHPEHEIIRQKRLRRLSREQANDGNITPLPPQLLDWLSCDIHSSRYFPHLDPIQGIQFTSHVINPSKLLIQLRQAGGKLGVRYISDKVDWIDNSGEKVVLKLSHQKKSNSIIAKQVVITTGCETISLLSTLKRSDNQIGFQSRLRTLTGNILVTQPFLPQSLGKLLISLYDKKYLLHLKDKALFGSYDYKSHANHLESSNLEDNSLDTIEQDLRGDLCRLFPQLDKHPPKKISMLSGKRLFNADKLPFLGRIDKNIYIGTALYKNGLSLAPWYSNFIVQLLLKADTHQLKQNQEISYLCPFRKRGLTDFL